MNANKEDVDDFELIWGARAIGKEINVTDRRAHYLLVGGHLKGAKKVGNIWTIPRRVLREVFESGDA